MRSLSAKLQASRQLEFARAAYLAQGDHNSDSDRNSDNNGECKVRLMLEYCWQLAKHETIGWAKNMPTAGGGLNGATGDGHGNCAGPMKVPLNETIVAA